MVETQKLETKNRFGIIDYQFCSYNYKMSRKEKISIIQ